MKVIQKIVAILILIALLGFSGCSEEQVVLNDEEQAVFDSIKETLSRYTTTQENTLYAVVKDNETRWGVIIRPDDALAYVLNEQGKAMSPTIEREKALQLREYCRQIASTALELMKFNYISKVNTINLAEQIGMKEDSPLFGIITYEFYIDVEKAEAAGIVSGITSFCLTGVNTFNKHAIIQIVGSTEQFSYFGVSFHEDDCTF